MDISSVTLVWPFSYTISELQAIFMLTDTKINMFSEIRNESISVKFLSVKLGSLNKKFT